MPERQRTYARLAAALALVLVVMAWVTATLLRLDAERSESERAALVEEQVRLALWRMDSAMAPLLSREAALLDAPVSSPLAEPGVGIIARFSLVGAELEPLTQIDPERLAGLANQLHAAELEAELTRGLPLVESERATAEADKLQASGGSTPYALKPQSVRNDAEWSQRRAKVQDNVVAYGSLARDQLGLGGSSLEGQGYRGDGLIGRAGGDRLAARQTPLEAVWLAGELLLVRSLGPSGPQAQLEGIWLDWPALRERLLTDIEDLLPDAQLTAVEDVEAMGTERLLATLPARLDPGATVAPAPSWSPLRASLLVAWLIVLAAFAGVVLLVRGSLELSERRATFVSAVTHELRTPLTTFRMYTEMLGEGMVEARKRERYVRVLRREAERLSALVENVLAYAQVERERGGQPLESLSLGALVERVEDRLRERCENADMGLELDIDAELHSRELKTDPTAVEQILFNLVDNAAKYGRAAEGEDTRVEIHARAKGRGVELSIRDFGPGIAPDDAKRVFEPFTKAKADAAGTKPGVGLGLALSRRLARSLGGELSLEAADPGARFKLSLPGR